MNVAFRLRGRSKGMKPSRVVAGGGFRCVCDLTVDSLLWVRKKLGRSRDSKCIQSWAFDASETIVNTPHRAPTLMEYSTIDCPPNKESQMEVVETTHHHFKEKIERQVDPLDVVLGNDEEFRRKVVLEEHHHFKEKIIRRVDEDEIPVSSSSSSPLHSSLSSSSSLNTHFSQSSAAAAPRPDSQLLKNLHQRMIMSSINYIPKILEDLEQIADESEWRRRSSFPPFFADGNFYSISFLL